MASSTSTDQKKLRILLIEDDKHFLLALKNVLEKGSCIVSVAQNGKEGIQKIKEGKPDLVFLDLMLPVTDGFQVLVEVKTDPKTKNIPIVILSNLGQDADITRGKELGALDYLIKSNLAIKDLLQKLETYRTQNSL